MAGPNALLTKTGDAGGAITQHRFLKMGASDDTLIQAVDGAAAIVGVSRETAASGARVDYDLVGLAKIKLGGTVARGDYLTADATGQGVVAAPSAGVNSNVGGLAQESGVSGDIINVLIAPGRIQG